MTNDDALRSRPCRPRSGPQPRGRRPRRRRSTRRARPTSRSSARGFSGLTAALRLAESGASVVVLEAGEPGWGASGRNGGQVIPGLKWDPDELVAMFGAEAGEQLARVAGGAADTLFELVERTASIARRSAAAGSSRPSPMPTRARRTARRAMAAARRRRRAARPRRACRLVGSPIYAAAGSIAGPARCSRSATRAAWRAPRRPPAPTVCGDSRVTALARDGARWRVTTAHGAVVTAGQVLLATNGYTDGLWPQLRQTVIAANSFQVATEPLPEALRAPCCRKARSPPTRESCSSTTAPITTAA